MFEGTLVPLLVKGVNSGSRLSAGESAFDSELYHTEEGQQQREADREMQVDGVDVEAPGLSGQERGGLSRLENRLPVFSQCRLQKALNSHTES